MKPFKLFLCYLMSILLLPFFSMAQLQDFQFLRVDNINDGYNKVKLGNNPDSFWNPKIDVTAGGNTHMSITFRVPEGSPDYSKIQIRPNGSSAAPLSLATYLPAGFSNSYDWTTIRIPLADFDTAIDLTNLYLIQIPYSADAGNFIFDLKRLEFTGGSTPYLWYGAGKRGNIHDGNGYAGQMIGYDLSDLYMNVKIMYRPTINKRGSVQLVSIYKDIYGKEFDSLWLWEDGYIGGKRNNLPAGEYNVAFGPLDGLYDTLSFVLTGLDTLKPDLNYVKPATASEVGLVELKVYNGVPEYYIDYDDISVALYNETFVRKWGGEVRSGYNPLSYFDQDQYFNYYSTQTNLQTNQTNLTKSNEELNLIWAKPLTYLFGFSKFYTDDLGRTFVFSRTRNQEIIIDNKRFKADNEAHVLVMYNPDGSIGWVKFFNDLLNSVYNINFVEDNQGRFIWGVRKADSKGYKTIITTIGMNGNTIGKIETASYSGHDREHANYDHMVTDHNRTILMTYQSEGTVVEAPTTFYFNGSLTFSKDGSYLIVFDEKMQIASILPQSNVFKARDQFTSPKYPALNDHVPLFHRTNEGPDTAAYVQPFDWERPYFFSSHENHLYNYDEGTLSISNYDLNKIGDLSVAPEEDSITLSPDIFNDHKGRIHLKYTVQNSASPDYGKTIYKIYTPYLVDSSYIRYGGIIAKHYSDINGNNYKFIFYDNQSENNRKGLLSDDTFNLEHHGGTLTVYPNPSASNLYFSFLSGLEQNILILTDLSGRVVGQWKDIPTQQFEVPRNNLQSGIYLLTFEDANGKKTKRVVFR